MTCCITIKDKSPRRAILGTRYIIFTGVAYAVGACRAHETRAANLTGISALANNPTADLSAVSRLEAAIRMTAAIKQRRRTADRGADISTGARLARRPASVIPAGLIIAIRRAAKIVCGRVTNVSGRTPGAGVSALGGAAIIVTVRVATPVITGSPFPANLRIRALGAYASAPVISPASLAAANRPARGGIGH